MGTIYGVNTQTTTERRKNIWRTVDWIKENFIIDESTGRIRFMVIEPRWLYFAYVDKKEKGLGEVNEALHKPKVDF